MLEYLVGMRFGKLTVMEQERTGRKKEHKNRKRWVCICDCGNTVVIREYALLNGNSRSCGCSKNDWKSKTKKKNTFEIIDDYVIGYTEKGESFYFDFEDFDLIKRYYWSIHNGYVCASTNNTRISLHRYVINDQGELVIDHINHNTTDNRKKNLRPCTTHQNVVNKNISKANTSGRTGVYPDKGKWRAVIFYNGKNIHLGTHKNFDDAVKAREKAEAKYFGEFTNIIWRQNVGENATI